MKNNIAVFTNLESIAEEIVNGAGLSHSEIIDFFEVIDDKIGQRIFTELVIQRFAEL